ncbi:MAG TPA: helix-turn-helix domain-containing protein [Eoetvoesiella sp.]
MASINSVPVYKLYGEHEQWLTPDMVHCESIADRSKLHNWQIKLHQHHGLVQLLYLQGGSAKVCLDGGYFDLMPRQIVMVPQMCIHGFTFAPNAQGHVVMLAYPLFNKLAQHMGDGPAALTSPHIYSVASGGDEDYVDMVFSTLDTEYRANAAHRNVLLEATLVSLLVWLTRNSSYFKREQAKELDRGRQHFRGFCQLIEESYSQQFLVDQYAKKIGITAAHLNVLCRQVVGQSALQLIHQRIVLEAKRSLVYTSMTISVVSDTLGFSDPAYFTRFFKRHVGMSPKDFRKQAETLVD